LFKNQTLFWFLIDHCEEFPIISYKTASTLSIGKVFSWIQARKWCGLDRALDKGECEE